MKDHTQQRFSDPQWLRENSFKALSEIAWLLNERENDGRDALIRVLEFRDQVKQYDPILVSLIQKAGLYPYLKNDEALTTADLLNLEFHRVEGLEEIILHSLQGKVYRALLDGANVILSAPTSFGKSLISDAIIASRQFDRIVVIVPTIALIDETRRRLSKRFSPEFKIITHPSQQPETKNIYVLTQERFIEFQGTLKPQFFVLDEFYKLSPERGDERTFVLNQAFYQLIKSGAQFFLIGPNVRDITIDQTDLQFRYFRTDFSTVATEVTTITHGDSMENALAICRNVEEPTLIFCKSAASAYKLSAYLLESGLSAPTKKASIMAEWLRNNYHPQWQLASLLDHGFAVHHGSLPRSIAYHLLRRFNDKAIRFLLCTSTIIEGVNTAAKHIIIYDNKIATAEFDQFTFNNIKGRAGRMFEHFVGHVHVLNAEPDPELPLVDIPSITQPSDAPESLLIQLDADDLSAQSKERLQYLHAQTDLPIEVMRINSGISPESQLNLAREIASDPNQYWNLLSWETYPTSPQLFSVCKLIFDYLMDGNGRDGVFTAKQLYMKISLFARIRTLPELIEAELDYDKSKSASDAVESVLMFMRRWGEFNFPRYLSALNHIQRSVFERFNLQPGDYEFYTSTVKHLFMPLSATVLEEYGLPYQVTLRIENEIPLGTDVDEILDTLRLSDLSRIKLNDFEHEMLDDVIANL